MQPNYSTLYTEYQADLLRYARLRSKDEGKAQDIVQNVFLRLLERKERQCVVKNWKTYLFIIVRNETVNYLRKKNLDQQILAGYQYFQPCQSSHDQLLEKEYRAKLLKAIAQLPPQQGLVFELHCVYNWKYGKVAEAMAISPDTVKNHMQAVRRKLTQMVA